jgi:hypothetical protein
MNKAARINAGNIEALEGINKANNVERRRPPQKIKARMGVYPKYLECISHFVQ